MTRSLGRHRSALQPRHRVWGFTLMELMTVLVIIGILAILVLPRFGQARRRALKSQMQSDLHALVNAQEAYFNRYYVYSDNVANLNFNITPNVTISMEEITGNGWSAKAVHAGTPAVCGIYAGDASPVPGIPGITEGTVACTG